MIDQNINQTTLTREKGQIINELNLTNDSRIMFIDTGWDNRVYFIPSLNIIYRFPRDERVGNGYKNEINILNKLSSLSLGVTTPKILTIGKGNRYYSYSAIKGMHLDDVILSFKKDQKKQIGTKLGKYLKAMHGFTIDKYPTKNIDDEINQLLDWSVPAFKFIKNNINQSAYIQIYNYVQHVLPNAMRELGLDLGLCHGDLHGGNILIDGSKIGLIDFGDASYMDKSVDFIGINDTDMFESMCTVYGVDDVFKQRISVRKKVFDFTKLSANLGKGDIEGANRVMRMILQHAVRGI